ncbi:hypothetical protein GOODEAATRI_017956, partial [Goodea atripinnis]
MLQSIKRAMAIEPSDPWLHQCLVRFFKNGEQTPVRAGVISSRNVIVFVLFNGLNPQFLTKVMVKGQCLLLAVSESAGLAEAVRTVLKQEISRLFGDSNPQSFNKNYLSQHSNCIPHRLA